jgi:hypothetical protein
MSNGYRLNPGNSLYAFCISPELTLEHLYWGETLPSGYDLRYLLQNSRMTVFNTTEVYGSNSPSSFGARVQCIEKAETIEELMEYWRQSRALHFASTAAQSTSAATCREELNQKRLENLSWRIMGREAQSPLPKTPKQPTSSSSRRRSWSIEPSPPLRKDINIPDVGSGPFSPESDASKGMSSPADRKHALISIPGAGVHAYDRLGGTIGKGNLCLEYSDHGTGDFRSPSFSVVDNSNGSSISPLRFVTVRRDDG